MLNNECFFYGSHFEFKKKTTSTAIPPSSASQLLFTISLSPRDNNGIERKTPSLAHGVCEFHQGYF